jgi:hypothetical protein
LREQAHHLGFDRHVRADRDGACAKLVNPRHDGICRNAIGSVIHAHRVAATSRQQRSGRADAATGAGDHDHFLICRGERVGHLAEVSHVA